MPSSAGEGPMATTLLAAELVLHSRRLLKGEAIVRRLRTRLLNIVGCRGKHLGHRSRGGYRHAHAGPSPKAVSPVARPSRHSPYPRAPVRLPAHARRARRDRARRRLLAYLIHVASQEIPGHV